MFFLLASFTYLVSSVTIASVFQGNWTFQTINPSNEEETSVYHFEVMYKSTIPNYLTTRFNDDIVDINVSFQDLSGNISYLDNVYDFNFTMIARPYISTDIDFGEYGIAHCSFSSYSSMHCVWIYQNETFSIYGDRHDFKTSKSDWLQKNGKNAALMILGIAIFFGFQFATKQLQRNYAEELQKRQAAEQFMKEKEEKEKEEKEKENGENAPETPQEGDENDKTDEAHEETEEPHEKLPNPDPDNKIKTD